MQPYELNYLLSLQLSEEQQRNIQDNITSLIESEGGVLDTKTHPTRKELAYPIKKQGSAYFGRANFYIEPDKLVSISKKLKEESAIIRFIFVKRRAPNIEAKLPGLARRIPLKVRPRITKLGAVRPRAPKAPKVEIEKLEEKLEEILKE